MSPAAAGTPMAGGKGGRPPGRHPRPAPIASASPRARQVAALILSVLGGELRPAEAAEVLGLSAVRYYILEQRALAGLVAACETLTRGPGPPDQERQLAALQEENRRLNQCLLRQQALVRAGQRSLGLAPAKAPDRGRGKGKDKDKAGSAPTRRRRRPAVRALRAAQRLTGTTEPVSPGTAPPSMDGATNGA